MTESFTTIHFGYLFLIIALYLLSQVKLLKKQASAIKFIPQSLIVGLVVSIGINLVPLKIDFESFSSIAFHVFNMSVISMGLTTSENQGKSIKNKSLWGGIWMTTIFTAILCIQSLTGFGSVVVFNTITDSSFFEGYGLLSGHGFAQGSGHSMAIGSVWEKEYNLNGAISIGLTFSAIGYLIAVVIGIPFTKWLLTKSSTMVVTEKKSKFKIKNAKKNISPPFKISKHIFNVFTIIIIYIISSIIAYIIRDIILRDFLKEYTIAQTISNIIIGLIFVIGLAISILFKTFLSKTKQKSFLNNGIQKRHTSTLIDLLIISTFLSIEYAIISQVGIPIIMIIVFNIITTCLAYYLISLKSNADFLNERIAALLGTSFGSLANGLILLKIVDPKIKSPVYYELALMNFYSVFTLGHIMIIIFAIAEWDNLNSIALIYAVTLILSLFIARVVEVKINNLNPKVK